MVVINKFGVSYVFSFDYDGDGHMYDFRKKKLKVYKRGKN